MTIAHRRWRIAFAGTITLLSAAMPALSAWQDPAAKAANEAAATPNDSDEPLTAKEAGPAAGQQPPFDLADRQRIEAGKAIFIRTCAGYCHGGGGEGGRAPSFRNRDDLDPAYAYKTIVNGRVASDVVPVFGHSFTPEQVWELVAYLTYLGTQAN